MERAWTATMSASTWAINSSVDVAFSAWKTACAGGSDAINTFAQLMVHTWNSTYSMQFSGVNITNHTSTLYYDFFAPRFHIAPNCLETMSKTEAQRLMQNEGSLLGGLLIGGTSLGVLMTLDALFLGGFSLITALSVITFSTVLPIIASSCLVNESWVNLKNRYNVLKVNLYSIEKKCKAHLFDCTLVKKQYDNAINRVPLKNIQQAELLKKNLEDTKETCKTIEAHCQNTLTQYLSLEKDWRNAEEIIKAPNRLLGYYDTAKDLFFNNVARVTGNVSILLSLITWAFLRCF
jgi:hypothetical protein